MRIIRCNRKISMYIKILYRICSRMCVKIDAINILKFHQHCAKHISRHRFNYYGILQPTLNVITFIETIKNPLYDHAIISSTYNKSHMCRIVQRFKVNFQCKRCRRHDTDTAILFSSSEISTNK